MLPPAAGVAELRPEDLIRDPNLLLHSAKPGSKVCAFDGLVGNVIIDGKFIITSPNANYIPSPPLGDQRHVFLRADYHYADDDPLLWPQPFDPTVSHLATIPRLPEDDSTHEVMWWPIDKFVFTAIPNTSTGHRLFPGHLEWIAEAVEHVLQRVEEHRRNPKTRIAQYINELSTFISDFLARLRVLPMRPPELSRCIVEIQRFWLELMALLDFYYIFKPRMESSADASYPLADVMGAFTLDPHVAQTLFRAGIPVWFIRQYTDAPHVRIDSICPLTPPDKLEFKEACPRFPTIFIGKATDPRRTHEIRVAAKIIAHSFDAFYWGHSAPRAEPPSSSAQTCSTSTRARIVVQPYEARNLDDKQRAAYKSRLVTIPLESQLLPPISSAWKGALSRLNSLPFPKEVATEVGYAFPDPTTFINSTTPHTYRVPYLCRFLQLRHVLLQRLTTSPAVSPASRRLINRVWRLVLSLDIKIIDNVNAATGKLSKSASTNLEPVQFLTACASLIDIPIAQMLSTPPIFRGQAITHDELQDPSVAQRVIWEVSELNFRADFIMLDAIFPSSMSKEERQECLLDCLCPAASIRFPLVVDVTQSSCGLSSPSPLSRLPQLRHIRRLFTSWLLDSPPSFHSPDCMSVSEVETLEMQLYNFFVEYFFKYFGRGPVVPRIVNAPPLRS